MKELKFEHPACKSCRSRSSSVFCDLAAEHLDNISDAKNCSYYPKTETIFQEGNRPKGVYCINSGKVKVYRLSQDGKEHIVRLVGPGDVIGYKALLGSDIYTETAAALEPTVVCFVPQEAFMEVVKGSPDFPMRMMELLSSNLQEVETRLANWAQKSVRERLAETLLMLYTSYGVDSQDHLNVELTREDLAGIVGTATESLIRTLSDLKKRKLIAVKGRNIKILNTKELAELANV